MIKLLVVGIGLGGCRFSRELSKKCAANKASQVQDIHINISADELMIFKEKSDNVLVGEADGGAGKSREKAMKIFTENFDYSSLLKKIRKRVTEEEIDMIAVCFSTGGGTGSSLGALLTQMLYQSIELDKNIIEKEVIVMGFGLLPSFDEGIEVFRNTLLCINDIKKSITTGTRFMMVKNSGKEGGSFVEKREFVNDISTKLVSDYLKGTVNVSKYGVLDLNDRRSGLKYSGLHSISRLKDCDILKSPFIEPGSSIVKNMMCEIPEDNSDMYEAKVSAGVNLDFKYGYTKDDVGVAAYHGFNNLTKETLPYRKRFDELKFLDQTGDEQTGANSLESLKAEVYNYDIREVSYSKEKKKVKEVSDKGMNEEFMNDLINGFKTFSSSEDE